MLTLRGMDAHERWLDAIAKEHETDAARKRKKETAFPRDVIYPVAVSILRDVQLNWPGVKTLIAGSIRRECPASHDIDILVCSDAETLERFRHWAEQFFVPKALWSGPEKVSGMAGGIQVDFRLITPEHWGASLQYFTGSRRHNIMVRAKAKRMGLLVNEYGVFDRATMKRLDDNTEGGVYKAVGLKWLPPKYREEGKENRHAD